MPGLSILIIKMRGRGALFQNLTGSWMNDYGLFAKTAAAQAIIHPAPKSKKLPGP
jgi:hypothetical protein